MGGSMLIQNWMTTEVITVTPETSLLKIGKLMRDNNVRRLPVLDDKGHVVGIISDRDVRDASPSKATTLDMYEMHYLLAELKAHKVKKVWLQPLMVVAGDHARNDLAGDEEDSWASRLKAAGFQVETNLKGLGQVPGVRDVFVAHAKENVDDLTKEPKKQ